MTMASFLLGALLAGPGAVVFATLFLGLPEESLERFTPRLLSFATGALLGMVFLRMLPEALEAGGIRPILMAVLAGLLALFLLERLRITRHCHERQCPEHAGMGVRVFTGNAAHNLVDGIALALAFQASIPTGWIMVLALLGHEVPKNIMNILLMRESASREGAVLWVGLASLFTAFGGLATMLAIQGFLHAVPVALALGSAVFLYMALADLVPRHRQRPVNREAMLQAALVLLGAGAILAIRQ